MTRGFRQLYGAGPLHLIGHVAVFLVAGFAIDQIIGGGGWVNWIVWFLGAALLHDLVLLPLYSTVDRIAQHAPAPRAQRTRPPLINHLRVPAAVSGILLLVYCPLILGRASRNYRADTGHPLIGYTRNWLLITGGLFLASALLYLVRRTPRSRALPTVVAVLTVATVATGLLLQWRGHVELGTPLPPFLVSWAPRLRWPLAIGAGVALAAVGAGPWIVRRVRPGAVVAGLLYVVTLAVGLAVNAARIGTAGWDRVFVAGPHGSPEGHLEYLPALPQLREGVGHYIRDFPQLLPHLPIHTQGNPPGPLVAMHLLSIDTPGRLAAACIVLGALIAPLTYGLGRTLGDERRGRVAGLLAALSPCVVLFGVTSVDFVFGAMAAAVAWMLVARRPAVLAAGCVAAGIAAFFSYVLLALPVWAVVVVLVRDGRRRALALTLAAIAGVLAVTGVLALAWGYDPMAILHAIRTIYAHGAASQRPYAFWLFGSPAAWLVMLGPVIAWAALRALSRRDPAAIGLAVIVVVSAVCGFTKGETERIWLPYVPLACVAAATVPPRRLRLALATLAVQALAVEALFYTKW